MRDGFLIRKPSHAGTCRARWPRSTCWCCTSPCGTTCAAAGPHFHAYEHWFAALIHTGGAEWLVPLKRNSDFDTTTDFSSIEEACAHVARCSLQSRLDASAPVAADPGFCCTAPSEAVTAEGQHFMWQMLLAKMICSVV